MVSEAQKRANAKYKEKILSGLTAPEGSLERERAIAYSDKLREASAKSCRKRYHDDPQFAQQKREMCRLAAYYDNSDGKHLLASRRLFQL
jgi:hypothetical protein